MNTPIISEKQSRYPKNGMNSVQGHIIRIANYPCLIKLVWSNEVVKNCLIFNKMLDFCVIYNFITHKSKLGCYTAGIVTYLLKYLNDISDEIENKYVSFMWDFCLLTLI